MLRKIGQMSKRESGQVLVELALLLPVLLIILFGIIEFGRVFNASLVVNHASREGARAGVVGATDNQIIDKVRSSAGNLNQNDLNITVSPSTAYRERGAPLIVQVDYQVTLFTPFVGKIMQNPFPVQGSTVMRLE